MKFKRQQNPKKSLQIGQDAFAFKPDEVIWQENKKLVHEWWIKQLLSKRRVYKYDSREIFLQEFFGKNKESKMPSRGFSLRYLRDNSEYKYVFWKGVYYEL